MLTLSPSGAELLGFCGVAFERRYIKKDRRRSSTVEQTVGKAVHLAARIDLETKRAHGRTIADKNIADLAADAFEAEWSNETPDIPKDAGDKAAVRGSAKDQVIALEQVHHASLAKVVDPKLIECRVYHPLPGYPFSIMGYVDLTETDDTVRDLKTRKKKPNPKDVGNSIQGAMYAYIIEKETEVKVPRFTLDVLVKTKEPYLSQVTGIPNDWSPLMQRFDRIAHVLDTGSFLPADPGHWKCSEKFCDYWDDCPFGRRRRSSFAIEGGAE